MWDKQMPEKDSEETVNLQARAVSRREFLKMAGIAGAAVGLGSGLGGALAACGGTQETSTTSGASTTATTAASSTTTAAASTTTVSAGPEAGREVKIGWVQPVTGAMAAHTVAGEYILGIVNGALGDGIVLGDGMKHKISIIRKDSQSDSNRAGQVAADLITIDKVDMLVGDAGPDMIIPITTQGEALGVPTITDNCPWEAWLMGRSGGKPETTYKWTYHLCWGSNEEIAVNVPIMESMPTNKVVGCLWPNDADGQALRAYWPPTLKAAGFTAVDGGAFDNASEDFTSILNGFKKAGAEVLLGLTLPPTLATFTQQANQQGFKPKIAIIEKSTLFPADIGALGPVGIGIAGNQWWHPTYPFKCSLNGQTCQELADGFEAKLNRQWEQPIGIMAHLEVAIDTLKRTKNVDDKESILEALLATKLSDSVFGPIDFTLPVAPKTGRPHQNAIVTPLYGGQWQKGTGKYAVELKVVTNGATPWLKIQSPVQPYMAG
jgi:branched-chain amino acid transport system substrate-binding protein